MIFNKPFKVITAERIMSAVLTCWPTGRGKSKGLILLCEAKEILMRKAQWLRDHPYVSTIIEGHTDEPGSKEYNIALGDRRAGEAKSFLIKQGIATERLIAVSYGNDKPIDPKRTEEAKKKNRRVHFVIE